MAYTRTWDDDAPAGTRQARELDDALRELRLDVHERLNTILGVAIGTDLADPLIASGNSLGGLDTRVDALEALNDVVSARRNYHWSAFIVQASTTTLTKSNARLTLAGGTASLSAYLPLSDIPPGATITEIGVYVVYNDGTATQTIAVNLIETTITSTTLESPVFGAADANPQWMVATGSHLLATDKSYAIELAMNQAATATDMALLRAKVLFTIPSLGVR